MNPEASGSAGLGRLVAAGVLDAELAALVWLLVEARAPALVAGASGRDSPRELVRDALRGLLPPTATTRRLAGPSEGFAWMPEAAALGWHDPGTPDGPPPPAGHERPRPVPVGHGRLDPDAGPGRADRTVMVADLDPDGPSPTWGERARVAIRALSLGYGMLAVAPGARLETVLGRLAAPPVGALDDELTRLGVVLILGPQGEDAKIADEAAWRIVAAHYLRPVARDAEGHVQRRPPAVLATWDAATGRFEHFAWGILGELAGRTGMTPVELERAQARRMEQLRGPGPDRTP